MTKQEYMDKTQAWIEVEDPEAEADPEFIEMMEKIDQDFEDGGMFL